MKKKEKTFRDFICSDDPLIDDCFRHIIKFEEEDEYVDYKQNFDAKNEKQWLELTKDIMAFSNAKGGFIVFGIEDATFSKTGLTDEIVANLLKIDEVQQKINRYIEPPITNIRAKKFKYYKKSFVVLFIPERKNVTHFISKDAEIKYQEGKLKGKKKRILKKGTSWIRRVGGNKLVDSRSIDEIFERRFNNRKQFLLENIAKVIDLPSDSEILIWSKEKEGSDYKKFVIEDAPEAIPIKGMSLTASPESTEVEIAMWCALYKTDNEAVPPKHTLWKWYSERENISPSKKQKLHIFLFSIISDIPFFYWLINIDSNSIKEMIVLIGKSTKQKYIKSIMGVSSFLGRGFFNKIKKEIGGNINKLKNNLRNWSRRVEKEYFHSIQVENLKTIHNRLSEDEFRKFLEKELETLVVSGIANELGAVNLHKAKAIDCYLYSQNDNYRVPVCDTE